MPKHRDLVDRDEFLLLVVDVQDRLAAVMERRREVVAGSALLIRAAAVLGAPIVVTRQYPRGLGDTVPELLEALEEARREVPVTIVDKTAFCACDEAEFLSAIEGTRRNQVVVAGMETHICVAQTALVLAASGLQVHVAEDACCSRRDRAHRTACERLRARGLSVTCAESVVYEAAGRAGTEDFKRLLALVKEG